MDEHWLQSTLYSLRDSHALKRELDRPRFKPQLYCLLPHLTSPRLGFLISEIGKTQPNP